MTPDEIIDALRDPGRRYDAYVIYEAANWIESAMATGFNAPNCVAEGGYECPNRVRAETAKGESIMLKAIVKDRQQEIDEYKKAIRKLAEERDQLFLVSQRWHREFNLAEQRIAALTESLGELGDATRLHIANVTAVAERYADALEQIYRGKGTAHDKLRGIARQALDPASEGTIDDLS